MTYNFTAVRDEATGIITVNINIGDSFTGEIRLCKPVLAEGETVDGIVAAYIEEAYLQDLKNNDYRFQGVDIVAEN